MEKTLKLRTNEEAIKLYGSLDENLRFAEKEFGVRLSDRNHILTLTGAKRDVSRAYDFFLNQLERIRSGEAPRVRGREADEKKPEGPGRGEVSFFHKGAIIKAKSKGQQDYLEAIQAHDIVIAIGPAGTGKTFLAMAAALDALKK